MYSNSSRIEGLGIAFATASFYHANACCQEFAMPETDPAARWTNWREDDFILKDYRFSSGEVLPELRLHYRTMGVAQRDTAGKIVNGLLLLQGNTGTGANWLRPSLADEL